MTTAAELAAMEKLRALGYSPIDPGGALLGGGALTMMDIDPGFLPANVAPVWSPPTQYVPEEAMLAPAGAAWYKSQRIPGSEEFSAIPYAVPFAGGLGGLAGLSKIATTGLAAVGAGSVISSFFGPKGEGTMAYDLTGGGGGGLAGTALQGIGGATITQQLIAQYGTQAKGWWSGLPTWGKALLIAGGVIVAAVGGYLLLQNADGSTTTVKLKKRARRYSIGANPRVGTLIKVSKRCDRITRKMYARFRHAGLIRQPQRHTYYANRKGRRDLTVVR